MQEIWRLFIEKASISYFISHLPPIYHHTKTLETKPFQHASGSMAANLKKKNIHSIRGLFKQPRHILHHDFGYIQSNDSNQKYFYQADHIEFETNSRKMQQSVEHLMSNS